MTRQVGQRWALTVQLSQIVLRRHRRMASPFPAALQVTSGWWRYNVRQQPRRAVGQETSPPGDTLVWTFDNTNNIGTGPLTLEFGKAVLAGGAAIQADFNGAFTAKVEAFNGGTLIGTATAMSDSNGDSVFIGIQDTAAEITSLVFDLTGCAMACDTGDFAVDKLISENPPAAVPGPIAGAGLPGLTLGRCWPSRLVATAEEDRLNILR